MRKRPAPRTLKRETNDEEKEARSSDKALRNSERRLPPPPKFLILDNPEVMNNPGSKVELRRLF